MGRRFKMRTVADLIDELRKHPPDRHVLVNGYESGYDAWSLSVQDVVVGYSDAGYEGRWQDVDEWEIKQGADPATEETVLVINRTEPTEIGDADDPR